MDNNILCITKDNTLYLYEIDPSNIYQTLNIINEKYHQIEEKTEEVMMMGYKPVLHEYNNDYCRVLDYKIIKDPTKKEPVFNEFTKIGGPRTEKMIIKVEYFSKIKQIIKETFFTGYGQNLNFINFTNLMKLYNRINKVDNDFEFDETLNSKVPSATSTRFGLFCKRETEETYNDEIELNKTEENITRQELLKIMKEITSKLNIKYICAFKTKEDQSLELEIMKQFGKRNGMILNYEILIPLLVKAQNTEKGPNSEEKLNDFYKYIRTTYDLNGSEQEKEIKRVLEKNKQ